MRPPVLTLLLLVGLLATTIAAAPGGVAEQPAASLTVGVDPAEATLQGAGTLDLTVDVTGLIRCSATTLVDVQRPEPVRGRIVLDGEILDRLQVRFEPDRFILEWERAGPADTFVMNETFIVRVHVGSAPTVQEQTDFSILIEGRSAQETRPRCSPDGYQVEGQSKNVPLIVSPEDDDGFFPALDGRVNWAPLVLAVVLLGIVAVFAARREKGRGGDG